MDKVLYHGSGYSVDKLMPGILYGENLVVWDETESNEWLYASSNKEEAILQGLASVLEKTHGLMQLSYEGNSIRLFFENTISTSDVIDSLTVYLYTVSSLGWSKVNNIVNGSSTEYKTNQSVDITSRVKVDLQEFLNDKTMECFLYCSN